MFCVNKKILLFTFRTKNWISKLHKYYIHKNIFIETLSDISVQPSYIGSSITINMSWWGKNNWICSEVDMVEMFQLKSLCNLP